MSNPSQGMGGTRDHTSLLNRNVVGQHTSESVGVLNSSAVNPNDIGRSWRSLGIIAPNIVRGASYLGNGIAIFGDNDGRIWRSADFGATWTNIGIVSHFAGQPIFTIAYSGNGIVICGDFSGYVHRSTDFGVTWTDLGVVSPTNIFASSFIGSSTAFGQGVVLLGDANGHIWLSGNNGATWADSGAFSTGFIDSITYLDNGIVIFTDSQGHIFRSTNGGTIWTDLGDFSTSSMLGSVYLGNGVALASDGLGHIFRSTNFGLTWTDLGVQSNGGSSIQALSYLGNGAVVFGDFNGHVFNSLDYGLTWTDNPNGAVSGTVIRTIAYLSSGVVISGDNNGTIFRSSTSFKTDEARATVHNDQLNRDIPGSSPHKAESVGILSPYSINPNDIGKNWVLTTVYTNPIGAMEYIGSGIVLAYSDVVNIPHILRSTDHGRIFFDSVTVSTGSPADSMSYFGNGIVVLGIDNGHIWRSTDFGLTFSDVGAISAFSIIRIKYLGHGYALAIDTGGFIQRSINFGATWPLAIGVTADMRTMSYLDNGIVIVGAGNGHIWRSTNIFTGFPSFSDRGDITGSNQTLVSSSYLGNGVVIVTTGNGHIIRSTDFGLNWIDLGLISASFFTLSAYLGNGVAICGTFNGGMWRSTDYGLNWTNLGTITGGPNLLGDTIRYIGNGAIVVGDANGNIYRSDVSYKLDETVQDIEKSIRTITTSETLTKIDETLLVDATAGNITIFLPSITVAPEHVFNFVRVDATLNTVTIDAAGAETINLALTQPLNLQFMALSMKAKPFAPNAGWWII